MMKKCLKQAQPAEEEGRKKISVKVWKKKESGCFKWKHLLVSRTRKLFKF